MTENGSDSHFRALCSENCHPGYVKIRDHEALKSQCCWSCQRCNKTEIAVGNTCMELPRRYLDISANPNDPFIGAVLFLSVFGLSLTLFVVVGLSSMETKL